MRLLLILLSLLTPGVAFAQRAVLPIREVDMRDGARRYAVTIMIDGKAVEAGLDTGSAGLRVLPRALDADAAKASGAKVGISYNSGVEFQGVAIRAAISMGEVSGQAKIMRIDSIGCRAGRPDCAAGKADIATYGIQGDGLPGEGFAAILGIRPRDNAVANPLAQLGVKRWIVDLPRPGETSGQLILNPDDAELAVYQRVGADDEGRVPTCLTGDDPASRICAPGLFDSGAPGIQVLGDATPRTWAAGAPLNIVVGEGAAARTITLQAMRRDQASAVRYVADPRPLSLSLGIAPYFRWSVLYDAGRRQIGLKAR